MHFLSSFDPSHILITRFAFVEYDSHRAAAMARRKLMNGRVYLWGHQLAVDWAEPELEVDEEIMTQVYTVWGSVWPITRAPPLPHPPLPIQYWP